MDPSHRKSVSKTMFNWGRLMSIIFLKSVDSFLDWIFSLSKDYRYVAYILKTERKKARERSAQVNQHNSSLDSDDTLHRRFQHQNLLFPKTSSFGLDHEPSPAPARTRLYMSSPRSHEPLTNSETGAEEFSDFDLGRNIDQNSSRGKKLLFGCYYATIAHSELICYFIIVLNQFVSASILAMPLPIMVFLWAMLSVPRPTKRFWITAITYTELVVVIKYLFQFQFYSWNSDETIQENIDEPFWWPRIVGIEKKDTYATCDLALLLALFFHRSILKMHGLWRDEDSSFIMKQNTPLLARGGITAISEHTVGGQTVDPITKVMYSTPSDYHIPLKAADLEMAAHATMRGPSMRLSTNRIKQSISQPESFLSIQATRSSCASYQTGTSFGDLSWHEAELPLPPVQSQSITEPTVFSRHSESASTLQRGEAAEAHSFAPEHSRSPSEGRTPGSSRLEDKMLDSESDELVDAEDDELGELPDIQSETKRRKMSILRNKMRNLGLEDIFRPVRKFYAHLIDPSMSASIDVYALMFFFDFITYLILIFNWWAFSDIGQNQNVTKYLEEDRIPSMFLAMLLCQFLLTVMDRAIYLRKFVLGKFVFQIAQVIAIHTWMFFIIPKTTKKKFTSNPPVQMWYFFRSIYFGLSAVQIRCGYPTRILGNFLAKRYSPINLIFFKMFRTVPFLLELRALMDWMWTDSSLMLFHWVRLEDIYASVFSIKCNRKFSQDFPYKRAAKRSMIIKYGVGGLLLTTLIIIIWFPLLFMSLVYTASVKNSPIETSVEVTIGAFQPIFKASTQQNLEPFSSSQYDNLLKQYQADPMARAFIKKYQPEDVVNVTLDGNSIQLWGTSPPSRQELINKLKDLNSDIEIRFDWYFLRRTANAQKASEKSSGHNSVKLLPTTRLELVKLLESRERHKNSVLIPNLFPKYIQVPSTGSSKAVDDLERVGDVDLKPHFATVEVQLNSTESQAGHELGMEWWILKEEDIDAPTPSQLQKLTLITFNERVFPQSVSFLAGYGIIGLYLSLVLVIGKFVRMFVSGISYKIPFDELPNVDKILKLCLDIFLCREVKEFALEEDLFAKLMYIYRDPQMLVKWTKLKLE